MTDFLSEGYERDFRMSAPVLTRPITRNLGSLRSNPSVVPPVSDCREWDSYGRFGGLQLFEGWL